MTRDASGTSWQPDSTPHEGIHLMSGDWTVMLHGWADGIYDWQGGPRGDTKGFSESMLMARAERPIGDATLGLRGMWSLDPAMGADGYPLLLQTGETANGVDPLIDRQHPHNLFMELASSLSYPLGEDVSAYAYFGLPGEPALGPPVYMHRFSAMDNPEAPLTHHWLDSTHVTFGVGTIGFVWNDWKAETSWFKGREPDEHRWGIESPRFDSWSARLSCNPTEDWALQVSWGHLASPEQLAPEVDQGRLTASASWNWRLRGNPAQTTFAWGRLYDTPGNTLDGFLLETAVRLRETDTLFARVERVSKDELFESGPLAGTVFTVNELSLGGLHDFVSWGRSSWGLGVVGSVYPIPSSLRPTYGSLPGSFMVFARAKLI
jgi:hypothetical protein